MLEVASSHAPSAHGNKSLNHTVHEQSMISATTSQLVKIKPNQSLRADNLIVISKAMAERTFKKLEDYFLNDD
jgi:hypothetical protein